MSNAPEIDFDHYSPDLVESAKALYADLRGRCPVARTPHHGGFHLVTGYDEIVAVLRDPATFSSAEPGGSTIPPLPLRLGFLEMDPPEHTGHRRVVSPFFSRTAIEQMRPWLAELSTACIDEFIRAGRFDIVTDLAERLPMVMTLELLGIPLDRAESYSAVFRAQARGESTGPELFGAMLADLRSLVRGRTTRDGGLIHAWQSARTEGRPLDDDQVQEFVVTVLSGGADTTAAALSHALLHLSRNIGLRQAIASDADARERFISEVLRVNPPATKLVRHVTRPVVLGGASLGPGDRVMLAVQSANQSIPGVDRPEEVRLDRAPYPLMTFGFGAHRCIAARLVPVVLDLVIAEVLRRLPGYEVEEAEVQRFPAAPLIDGFLSIPARFAPGPKLGKRSLADLVAAGSMSGQQQRDNGVQA